MAITILVVDDEIDTLHLVEQLLGHRGYQALTAQTGAQALLLLERIGELPRLAILDVVMPGMDGLQLAAKIKARWDIPIIFLSGVTTPTTQAEAIRLYAEDYIVKPFDTQAFLARIERVLQRTARPAETAALRISVHTVRYHVDGIYDRLGVHSRAEAISVAHRLGLLPRPLG